MIRTLTDQGVLPEEFGSEFEGIAGLRNVLVHGYAEVSIEELSEHLGRLDDFRTYAEHIIAYLEEG